MRTSLAPQVWSHPRGAPTITTSRVHDGCTLMSMHAAAAETRPKCCECAHQFAASDAASDARVPGSPTAPHSAHGAWERPIAAGPGSHILGFATQVHSTSPLTASSPRSGKAGQHGTQDATRTLVAGCCMRQQGSMGENASMRQQLQPAGPLGDGRLHCC